MGQADDTGIRVSSSVWENHRGFDGGRGPIDYKKTREGSSGTERGPRVGGP